MSKRLAPDQIKEKFVTEQRRARHMPAEPEKPIASDLDKQLEIAIDLLEVKRTQVAMWVAFQNGYETTPKIRNVGTHTTMDPLCSTTT
jgi:hypothetical protein